VRRVGDLVAVLLGPVCLSIAAQARDHQPIRRSHCRGNAIRQRLPSIRTGPHHIGDLVGIAGEPHASITVIAASPL
jgi:hypothetical protein